MAEFGPSCDRLLSINTLLGPILSTTLRLSFRQITRIRMALIPLLPIWQMKRRLSLCRMIAGGIISVLPSNVARTPIAISKFG